MKKCCKIELYSPGIVIFDPEVLKTFLTDNNIFDADVFSRFLEDESLGRAAINQGVVCPIYQIPEREYSVFILDSTSEVLPCTEPEFVYDGFPLQVRSEVVIISDLNALLDWDAEFFSNYKREYRNKLPSNDYLEALNGLYNMTVAGYSGLQPPFSELGYGIKLLSVNELPKIGEDSSIEDRDYTLSSVDQRVFEPGG